MVAVRQAAASGSCLRGPRVTGQYRCGSDHESDWRGNLHVMASCDHSLTHLTPASQNKERGTGQQRAATAAGDASRVRPFL